jgi:aldose 1-epimerase
VSAPCRAECASQDGIATVRLSDPARQMSVAVVPSIGNTVCAFEVNGKNVFHFPAASLAEFRERRALAGNPFLAPWANRLDGDAFWANGARYGLNPALGNLRRDSHGLPIHGLLAFSPHWQVVETGADAAGAWCASRLDFWKFPDLMAQFPFAHSIEMRYRLAGGALEVATRLENLSVLPMPVAVGFHPYFRLHDAPRDQWRIHIAACDRLTLSSALVPTGERHPALLADPLPLAGAKVDDVFSGLIRGADNRAVFWAQGIHEKISVVFGPKYTVAVVYAPPGEEFICFEPMSAITNAFNLAEQGLYGELQSIAPGGVWEESFWIVPEGFSSPA